MLLWLGFNMNQDSSVGRKKVGRGGVALQAERVKKLCVSDAHTESETSNTDKLLPTRESHLGIRA